MRNHNREPFVWLMGVSGVLVLAAVSYIGSGTPSALMVIGIGLLVGAFVNFIAGI